MGRGKGKVEARVGGKFELFDGWVKGRVVEFRPGKLLVCTGRPSEWPDEWEDSVVKYTLSAASSGTKVSLEHSGLPSDEEYKNHKEGWHEYVFDPLKEFLRKKEHKKIYKSK